MVAAAAAEPAVAVAAVAAVPCAAAAAVAAVAAAGAPVAAAAAAAVWPAAAVVAGEAVARGRGRGFSRGGIWFPWVGPGICHHPWTSARVVCDIW